MLYDYVIVGAGIGGVCAYAILKKLNKKVLLIEKLDYVGGCAGTFEKEGILYNAGASTLVGLDETLPLGFLLKILKIDKNTLPVKPIDPSIVVFVKDKIINRFKDRYMAFEEINKSFYHKTNKALWDKIYKVSDENWKNVYNILPFNPKSPKMILSFFRNLNYALKNGIYFFISAKDMIKHYIKNIEKEYIDFLNSQILMTSQGYWDEVSFSVASLGLTYPNLDNYYVIGGINKILEALIDKEVLFKTKVKNIKKNKDVFIIQTSKGDFEAKKVILNKTIWDYCEILDESIKPDCNKNIKTYNKLWSSSTIYFSVEDPNHLLDKHHYQIIHEKNPYTDSYSFFMSVSDIEDDIMAKDRRSITISTHSKIDLWYNLPKDKYHENKEKFKEFVFDKIEKILPFFKSLKKGEVYVGTPITFNRYTNRYKGTVGGIPLLKEYTTFRYPMGITPIKDLFLVGDSIFPGQGFPGVILGVINMMLIIEKDFQALFRL